MEEKVKPIVITDNATDEKYVLEFSRESIKFAELRGFNISDVTRLPMTKVPELFFYAFRMHHKNIARDKTDKILFECLGGLPDAMIERLADLYAAPLNTLHRSDDEEPKNVQMTVEM